MPFVADEFTGRRFGKYEVLCRLAVGGMAEIFLGFPLAGPFAFKPLVLKRILSDHREDPSSLQMLIDEAKLTAQLHHKHVAQVLDLEVAGEDVILVIELIQGANLEELVEVVTERKEVLPLGFVIAAIRDAAQGLQHAHGYKDSKGGAMPIIHRDVTPRNLMVTFDGLGKVLDFGIARAVGASRRTVAGMVRGTAAYMSPEQAIDAKVDTRTDIFSLGTIFHELLTGQRLFARGNPGKEMAAVYEAEIPVPSVVNKRVPKALDAVVLRALERSVSRRYQMPIELIRDIGLAAGSTAWPPERCGELVADLFKDRKVELGHLLERIPDEAQSAVATDVGRERLSDAELAGNDVRTVVGLPVPDRTLPGSGGPAGQSTIRPPRPSTTPPRKAPTSRPPAPARAEADAAAPTKFFTPEFGAGKGASSAREGDRITDEGPIPDEVKAPMPTTLVTEPRLMSPNLDQTPAALPMPQRRGDDETPAALPAAPPPRRVSSLAVEPRTGPSMGPNTDTQPAQTKGGRTAVLIIGAIGAMVLGAAGGVLVYRSMAPQKQQAGVGRVSVSTDRPAEVKIGDTIYKAPFADVYLGTGKQVMEVRELGTDGQWKRVEFEISSDKVTKLEIHLDATTAPAPPK